MLLFRLPLFHSPFLYVIWWVNVKLATTPRIKKNMKVIKKKTCENCTGSSLRLSSLKQQQQKNNYESEN